MRITPIEIQQHQFKTRVFGYDTTSVDSFLEMVADEIERLHVQNNELKESLARTRSSLDEFRDREKALQETLMTAQQVTEELKVNARKEAEILIAEAHIEGEQIIRDANERRMQLLNEIQEIRRQKISFEGSLRAVIENHLKLMDMDVDKTLQIEEDVPQAHLTEPLLTDDDLDERFDFP